MSPTLTKQSNPNWVHSGWFRVLAADGQPYYAALLPRRGRILRRTLSVCPSVCLSVRPVRPVLERHLVPPSELQ